MSRVTATAWTIEINKHNHPDPVQPGCQPHWLPKAICLLTLYYMPQQSSMCLTHRARQYDLSHMH